MLYILRALNLTKGLILRPSSPPLPSQIRQKFQYFWIPFETEWIITFDGFDQKLNDRSFYELL